MFKGFDLLRMSRKDASGSYLPYTGTVFAGQTYGMVLDYSAGSSSTYRPFICEVTCNYNRADLETAEFRITSASIFPNFTNTYPVTIRLFATFALAEFWGDREYIPFNMTINNSGNVSSSLA